MEKFDPEIDFKIRAIAASMMKRKLKELGKTPHDVELEPYKNALGTLETHIEKALYHLESRIVINTSSTKE